MQQQTGDIRHVCKADDGKLLISLDFKSQELRIAATLTQDEKMQQIITDGLDVYSYGASIVYNLPYEECVEFFPDGTLNKAGKARRSKVKAIILGIMYGKGVASIADDLAVKTQDAQKLYNEVLNIFPGLKKYMAHNIKFAKDKGYVKGITGLIYRLPDIQLSKYEFVYDENIVPDSVLMKYYNMLKAPHIRYDDFKDIADRAKNDGLTIINNSPKIAEMERKTVNYPVQGSASVQVKMVMVQVANDPLLNELDCRILLTIHDEIICECPENTASAALPRLLEIISSVLSDRLAVPSEADVAIFKHWDGEKIKI